jgi:hypothetical protein
MVNVANGPHTDLPPGCSGHHRKVNRSLSEGRRRFHDRLAGIESGAECERRAPQLSALADGEADAADMTLLRPHLRSCLICRARLRDYRGWVAFSEVSARSLPRIADPRPCGPGDDRAPLLIDLGARANAFIEARSGSR